MKQLGLTRVNAPERKECVTCINSKITRKPLASRREAHSDMWGPDAVPSFSGCRYFCLFVDEASRFDTLYVLKERSELYEIFAQYYKNVEVQKNVRMKRLNMDNANEYLALKKRCEDELGMECTLTIKKTLEHNGIAERMNRTLAERTRCVLFEGNLPTQLWAEAAMTCAYCLNLLPDKVLGCLPISCGVAKIHHFDICEYLSA